MANSNRAVDTTDSVSLNELVSRLMRCIKVQRPAFLWAGPGVGKSSIVGALAKMLGGVSVDLRLSQMQPTDIIGIPFYVPAENNGGEPTMRWAPPELLPSAKFAKEFPIVILFLDEMNSAPPAVQAAAYQLVLDRRSGAYKLPDNVMIIAAGNREGDRGVTYRMPSPLANRFLHFDVKVEFESWLDWAIDSSIHSDVIAFITNYKDDLFAFDANSADKSFPTPRSWEFVSQLLSTDTAENPMSDSEKRSLIGSAVGLGHAVKFMNYLLVGKDLPKPADILSGKIKDLKIRDVSAHYQLIVSMLYEMRDYWHSHSSPLDSFATVGQKKVQQRKWNSDKDHELWQKMFDNFNTFIVANISLEIGIMAMRMAVSNYYFSQSTDMTKLKTWPKMAEKYFPFMKDA